MKRNNVRRIVRLFLPRFAGRENKKSEKLSLSDVQHVADLAKLRLSADEIKKFQKQLNEVLDYVSILKKLNTKNVEPTSQVTGLENVFQEDKIQPSLSAQETLSGTSKKYDSLFKTKAIFEK